MRTPQFGIDRSGSHPAIWEKRRARACTRFRTSPKYPELRSSRFKLFNKEIQKSGGFMFYVGGSKSEPQALIPISSYGYVLRETIKRIDQHCTEDCQPAEKFLMALDEHDQRSSLITHASVSMYGSTPRRSLIEPPFQLESHRYQTMQAADWIARAWLGLAQSGSTSRVSENAVFQNLF
ncbi:MAG: DUF3800 domain-containing protein [Paracoccaceae bacterium]